MLDRLNQFFAFSHAQLKFLAVLSAATLVMAAYLFIRSHASPTEDSPSLPVFLGDEEKYTGLFILDPNTAPADSLELLPGIGKVLADRIVEFRQHDQFAAEIDITRVKGITTRLFERIRPYLKVRR